MSFFKCTLIVHLHDIEIHDQTGDDIFGYTLEMFTPTRCGKQRAPSSVALADSSVKMADWGFSLATSVAT